MQLALPVLDGGDVSTGRYRGDVVVVHLFTTWSVAAQADLDQLREVHALDGVTVIGVSMDPDGYQLVAPWRDANAIPYLVTLAPAALTEGRTVLDRIVQVPTTVVIDPAGRLWARIDRGLRAGELRRACREASTRR